MRIAIVRRRVRALPWTGAAILGTLAILFAQAIMTYDSYAPAEALAGRYLAWQTERVLSLIGDRVTVFMGVPTYRSPTPWAENLPVALRGVRQGVERLPRRPRHPFGVALYAEWTTNYHDWATYRLGWRDPRR